MSGSCRDGASKRDEAAVVRANREVAPGFFKMTLDCPAAGAAFKPGQFFQLRLHEEGGARLLRRPFAPSETHDGGFSFIYAVVGGGTAEMSRLKKGAPVRVLAPLGNGYRLPRTGSRALLVGGGCGTPSLRLLGERLAERGVEVFAVIGSRSSCTLLEKQPLKRISTLLAVATDDGSEGLHGHAVEAARLLLAEIGKKPAPKVFGCGPYAMLKGLAGLCAEAGLECQVSLEERMACGFGACMGCAVPVRADNPEGFVYRRVCHDGPVFDARELVWR